MDYTNSSNHLTHSTGQRLHTNQYSPTTRVTDSDINGPAFEILAVIEAAGITPMPFDVEVPASYSQLHLAIQQLVSGALPAGFTCHFAGASAPTGWLACNGAAVSRVAYANLFAAIGATYGAGDGSTTFNLPDLRGEFLRGHDAGRGVDAGRVLGSSQVGSLNTYDNTPAAVRVTALYNADLSDAAFRARLGVDPIDARDLSSIGLITAEGIFDAETVTNASGVMRPRNIAMTACIKY